MRALDDQIPLAIKLDHPVRCHRRGTFRDEHTTFPLSVIMGKADAFDTVLSFANLLLIGGQGNAQWKLANVRSIIPLSFNKYRSRLPGVHTR